MNPAKTQITELQEITFWQQLNKQLLEKRSLGVPVTNQNQKAFQKFCFDNCLFHRITKAPLLYEIPIAMVTDFDGIGVLTYYIDSWVDCLTTLLPNAISLDIEQAQADAFDAMTNLDRKYRFFETTPADLDADDDKELYALINEYNSIIDKQGHEFSNALRFLYELKADVINRIVKEHDGQSATVSDQNSVFFDFRDSQEKDRIMALYHQNFCNEALKSISKFTDATGAFLDMEILGLLDRKESEHNLKSSILQFIRHERDLIERKEKLMKEFYNKLKQKSYSSETGHIRIIDIAPFVFLKSPFPEV
jgi:hypothetical protein